MPTTVVASTTVTHDDGTTGTARIEADWNQNNRKVSALRLVSTSARPFRAKIESPLLGPSGGVAYVDVEPHGTFEYSPSGSLGLTWNVAAAFPDDGEQVLDGNGNPALTGFTGG